MAAKCRMKLDSQELWFCESITKEQQGEELCHFSSYILTPRMDLEGRPPVQRFTLTVKEVVQAQVLMQRIPGKLGCFGGHLK